MGGGGLNQALGFVRAVLSEWGQSLDFGVPSKTSDLDFEGTAGSHGILCVDAISACNLG